MNHTKESIKHLIDELEIKYVRLSFLDLESNPKYLFIPTSRIDEILDGEISFDGSSVKGFMDISHSDLYLLPDLNSGLVLRHLDPEFGLTLQLSCFINLDDGVSYPHDPRYLLKKCLQELKQNNYDNFYVGFEPEFYLLRKEDESYSDQKTYFESGTIEEEKCIKEIVYTLEETGFVIRSFHHEVGHSQYEINYLYSSPLEAIDKLIILKEIVTYISNKYHLTARFDPKLYPNTPGNGMHTNCSLVKKNKQNAFYDYEKKTISKEAIYFVNGILKHAYELSAFTNSSDNSYERLNEGFEAPKHIIYGYYNRSALIRIPKAKGKTTRIELRNVDSTASLYLLVTAMIYAGLEGIKQKLEIYQPYEKSVYKETKKSLSLEKIESLPSSLEEALDALNNSEFLRKHLGNETITRFISLKRKA